MNIGLIFGGKSFEHDISIITANLAYHALKEEHTVHLLYIDREGNFKYIKKLNVEDFINENKKFSKFSFAKNGIMYKCKKIMLDVIISAMHGTNGEDGVSSVIANLYNIPFVGSNHISSGVLLDKYFSYAVLCSNGIRTIDTEFRYRNDKVDFDKYPLIIKPSRLGSSIGIYKANDENELIINLNKAFMFDNKVVIQPFIKEFKEYNQAVYINCGKLVFSNVEEVFKSDNILSFDDKYYQI